MRDDEVAAGCVVTGVVFAVIVGLIYWRANNATEFWTMLGIAIAGLILVGLALYFVANDSEGCGCIVGIFGLTASVAVIYFVFTGNYTGALQTAGLITATPVATNTTVAEAAATDTALPPTVTPEPTETPEPEPENTATAVPVVEAPQEDVGTGEKEVPWWRPDPKYEQTLTSEIEQWRRIAAVVIAIQYVLLLWIARKIRQPNLGRSLVVTIVSALLVFTVYGEWIYRFVLWLFDFGVIGQIVVLLIAAVSGLTGMGNLTALIIGGYLYYDKAILLWCLAPSLIIASIAIVLRLIQVSSIRVPEEIQ